ncbi:hypothetical protein, partial [Raoultella ornithinolytica]|uniref:hypothetical protein n=1 Tax=Raoultella ornithinolytica TaxID=54291 RepID=UPI00384CAB3B
LLPSAAEKYNKKNNSQQRRIINNTSLRELIYVLHQWNQTFQRKTGACHLPGLFLHRRPEGR